ncbi:phosphoglycerate dehydrogenase-like enzyme [Catenisphaera adipataccumulans]|uniref:Phosphoglycerate dehydrogenase-like enzyme n=2 Tax=Catenisphaera adipataccumulans TaxID=700500 RepID=A0A7W8CZP4_9FIRM|nr:phosphoglycerate dehydrogenase-like enzyme [Catenisphaera adipataccumulans]
MDINDTGKPLSADVFRKKASQADAVIVGVDRMDADLIDACPNLKIIVKFGVGTDNIDVEYCKQKGIQVERCIGTNANAVAEYTIGMLFNCARSLSNSVAEVKEGSWKKTTGIELTGKNIGIIGFGHIGKLVAKMAYGIGMNVLVYDAFELTSDDLDACQAKQCTLQEILQEADFITIHVPLTEDTKNLIAAPQFKTMKSSAVLVNASRGGIVNDQDALDALKNNEIKAYAADVFESEPPEDIDWQQELLSLDSFYLTPHIGSRSKEAEINTVNRATDILFHFFSPTK